MSRSSMRFFKGMGFGVAVGMAAGVTVCCYLKQHRRGFKRSMSKALRNMGDLVEHVNEMF